MRYVLLTTFALMLAGGQVLFKKAAIAAGAGPLWAGIVNSWTVAALALYAAATVLWIAILRTTPLSQAYPFAALGFVIVPLASTLVFAETLSPRYGIGVMCIVAGILLTSL
jgi:multidrug transporter EmrE-like cation transporter